MRIRVINHESLPSLIQMELSAIILISSNLAARAVCNPMHISIDLAWLQNLKSRNSRVLLFIRITQCWWSLWKLPCWELLPNCICFTGLSSNTSTSGFLTKLNAGLSSVYRLTDARGSATAPFAVHGCLSPCCILRPQSCTELKILQVRDEHFAQSFDGVDGIEGNIEGCQAEQVDSWQFLQHFWLIKLIWIGTRLLASSS